MNAIATLQYKHYQELDKDEDELFKNYCFTNSAFEHVAPA